ncbi:MAG: hypothetical protein K1060chlam1_00520 [Candidatus Anoxychlamydiales bacterium]|nr:hypothetical protein [Candidatus Anoxychlamydiales bacterium]
MNLSIKITWILLSIAITRSVFADNCEPCPPKEPAKCDPCYERALDKQYDQGHGICEGILPKAYNASGSIDLCGGLGAYVIGSFIYWESLGDQLDLGRVRITSPTPQELEFLEFKTGYHMGFKVGLGSHLKKDNWDLFSQYTRLHKKENTIFDPANKTGTFSTSWFQTISSSIILSEIISGIRASWKIELDKIDLELGRSYYIGNSVISRSFVSLSFYMLDQIYDLALSVPPNPALGIDVGIFNTSIKNDSWAIGPRFGLSTSWFIYKGFNLFGSATLSLMFAENEISGLGIEDSITYTVKKKDIYILRDVEEFSLGLSWGSYLTHDKWHFNISAAYEAQRYSHTNYMSYVSQLNDQSNEVKPGDLYLHGVTIVARFDF